MIGQASNFYRCAMRVKVSLYVFGKIIDEYVEARDYEDAKSIALRRNSDNAKIISVTAVFQKPIYILGKFLIAK